MSKNEDISVAIILGYFNGQHFIKDQLISIFNQNIKSFKIFLYDDKSSYPFSLDEFHLDSEMSKKLIVNQRTQNVGFVNNFLKGLKSVPNDFQYYSFCDQDDIWYKNKLEKALSVLERIPNNIPKLYCGRTEIIDSSGKKKLGYSPIFKKSPSFANALVQNIGGGNTMVFNRLARDLIINSSKDLKVVSHDWWCYQIVTGAGGHVIYDDKPSIKYRQHSNNQVGANNNWLARLERLHKMIKGHFRAWNDMNSNALYKNKSMLTYRSQRELKYFMIARKSTLLKRLILFKRSGIYRQTFLGNLGLIIGILVNKV